MIRQPIITVLGHVDHGERGHLWFPHSNTYPDPSYIASAMQYIRSRK